MLYTNLLGEGWMSVGLGVNTGCVTRVLFELETNCMGFDRSLEVGGLPNLPVHLEKIPSILQ